MALNVVRKSRGGLKWKKQPVEQEVQKKVSMNLSATKPKANKQPTCNSEQETRRKKIASKDLSTTEPAPKRARKMLNKKERKDLGDYLKSVDDDVLMFAVRSKLLEQPFLDTTNDSIEALFENKELLSDILNHHHCRFVELFLECQKGVDSFLHFQLQWHQHCSAFLLSKSYPLAAIHLDKTAESSVAPLRTRWLDFCESNGLSELESNKVMIPMSSAVYELLLERAEDFQKSLKPTGSASGRPADSVDGDDVYFRFCGAAFCDMLHQRYKQIKCCQDAQRYCFPRDNYPASH